MRRSAAPWVALSITLLLTVTAATIIATLIDARDRVRFDNAVRLTESQIRERLQTYVAVLRSGDGFFAASTEVDRDEFREFIEHLDVQGQYPGIQGIGFARRTAGSDVRDLEEDARSEGLEDFRVTPMQPGRSEYYPILYLEPDDVRNRAAFGYDMFSERVRSEAMKRARDSGEPTMSGRVQLLQELDDSIPQPGFLIYQPTYRFGPIPATPEARRELVEGFIYSPFRAGDFFRAIFPPGDPAQLVAFRVFDGPRVDPDRLLYDSSSGTDWSVELPPGPQVDTMEVAGRIWTLEYQPLPTFFRGSSQPLVPLLVIAGLLVSLLVYRVTRAQVVARSRAEQTEATRARFFAAMSHELRTPINAILGYNDLLLSGVYGELPPGQRHGIVRSQKAAKHLAELVNDVLDLSKIEAGKLRLDFEQVNVGETIEDLLTTIRPLAEERGSEMVVVPCACRDQITTDPRRLRQILLNLLSNATKFGAGKPIQVRCGDADGGFMVEVMDEGPGIPQEELERIFEEFVQLDSTFREGTGLGLAISRRLAGLLGGRLTATSEPGRGARFRLWLPDRPARPTS